MATVMADFFAKLVGKAAGGWPLAAGSFWLMARS
jgi:hypothetical protein